MGIRSAKTARQSGGRKEAQLSKWLPIYLIYLNAVWTAAWFAHRALWAPENWLDSSMGTFWYWVIIKVVFWILPALWLMRRCGLQFSEVMGFKQWKQAIIWGGGLGLLMLVTIFITKAQQGVPYLSVKFGPAFWSAVVLAPFAEALVFRGLVFRTLRAKLGFFTTNAITSVLAAIPILPAWYVQDRFSYMVSRPFGGLVSLLLLSFAYGYIVEKSKSTSGGWLAHTLTNYANL